MNGTCANKKIYYSEKDAKKAAKKIRKNTGKQLYLYNCPDCDFYHLSSTDSDTFRIRQIARRVK